MSKYQRILCPVDFSKNSYLAIELATTLAKQHDAKVAFCYVSSIWDPGPRSQYQEWAQRTIEEEKTELYRICPADSSVEFEHLFLFGNPGPALVKATKTADMVAMSTHGVTGVMRLILGSVASYVMRNSTCPVYLVKGIQLEPGAVATDTPSEASQTYITEFMHQVSPVHAFETMESVLKGLKTARETAAPVVNGSGKCIGILTTTDIERFHTLQKRFNEKDETVLDEMFEIDEYGQRRTPNYNFDQVERHMTKEVVSVQDTDSVQVAIDLFEANPNIHHLVVMNEYDRAVGIVDAENIVDIGFGEESQAVS
jgi:nucleotide-binding universal stress UspA family protein/predicted transcriptional regulator